MRIERTDKEILIRLNSNLDITELQRFLDYIRFREITAKSKATDEEIERLTEESKKSWWDSNRDHFLR
jgi:hypothetical protein